MRRRGSEFIVIDEWSRFNHEAFRTLMKAAHPETADQAVEARATARPQGPERDSARNSPEGLQGESS